MSKNGYYSGAHRGNNVYSFLEDHVRNIPDRVVLRWARPDALKSLVMAGLKPGDLIPHDSITVRQMHDLICRTASGFQDLGLRCGDRVILFVPMSLPLYVSMFALQMIGAIPVFLDSWARRSQLGVSAKVVTPKAIISFEKAFELCATVPELAGIPIQISLSMPGVPSTRARTARLEELMRHPKLAEPVAVEQEHTALVTFTTGSSGDPKGANRTHRFLAAQHYALDECIPYEADDADLPVFPIFSLNNLAAGVTTVIPAFDIGTPGELDPQILLAQLASCGVTCTTLSPSLYNRLSNYCLENGVTLDRLRRVVTGGAPISRDNIIAMQKVAPRADNWVLFGSTEAEPMAHIEGREMINQKTRAQEDPEWVDDGVNVGRMAEGLSYRFLKIHKGPIEIRSGADWKDLEVAKGEVGELIVAGEHVCRDYYNNEEAFKRAKVLDENSVVWHRTGDLGRLDEEGFLWIVGRVHNAIQRSGRYVFPVRAEMILRKLPSVSLAAYLGVPDSEKGEKTVCVVVLREDGIQENIKVEAEILRIMEKNGMPVDQVVFRAKIPLDSRHHSKVEYDVLRAELLAEVKVPS
jgi:olefin beta-lactone synthetase